MLTVCKETIFCYQQKSCRSQPSNQQIEINTNILPTKICSQLHLAFQEKTKLRKLLSKYVKIIVIYSQIKQFKPKLLQTQIKQ